MNRIVASAQISLMDYNDAIVTGSMPANPEKDMLWLNTSVNPHIMKQYTGSEWIIVGELDPEYTEKLEVITGNIENLELTLGNMADDGKLDYGDRQEIVDKLSPIIGYLPSNISVTLKTVSQLDADKKGSFYQLRQSAQNAGIVTSSTAYTGLASAWNALRAYLGGLEPKPWDLSTLNQDAVVQVDKGTFRTHWLNYYNAEYALATATTQILHSAISTINTTTLPAMRDSALSSGEKAAIKQSLIILSSEKTAMDGEIIGLKANPKFENQTPLNEAKSAYDTSYTGVTTAINAVLEVPTGTLIPSTLILGVENAVSSYSAKFSLLKKAMQDSQTAIAKKVSDDASKELSDSLKGYVDKITYGQDIEEIQNQVDGAIMTWFGDNEPTLLTAPAKDWNTTALKDVHLGDLYYDNISGYGYRFGKEGTLYRWIRIVDADVVAALAAAQNAQDTADGKRRAFYNQPTPPYDIGDLWVQGANGELMRAIVTKNKGGIYHESDWVKATKYTDDTALENLEIGGTNLLRNSNFATGDLTGWTNNGSVTYALVDNKKCAYINTSSNGIYQSNVSKDEDAFYSVSFLAKALDSATSSRIGFLNATGEAWKIFTFTTEWRKYTFTTGAKIPAGQVFHIYGQGKRFYITNIQVERGMKATDWSASPEDVSAEISSAQIAAQNYATNHITQNIQPQIDGKIESFSQTTDPSVAWTTTLDKTKHEGDLWYHPTSKETKRWNGTAWIKLEDKAALDAANLAATKMQVFIAQPKGPYYVGDLWVQGTTGDLMRCQTQNLTVNGYNASHWAKATKYTDDTTATAAATAASNAQIAANKAQEDATKANGAVSDIISDNKMTPDEKVILQREWLNIQYERNEILPQSERYAIDNSSYRSVYDTLNGYLSPFFTNLTTTQDVNGETLRSNFQRYYEQRQAILDAISVAARQKVLDLQTQVDAGPFADKTSVLSGTEIFTDKADDSVVHVDIDGKSVQGDDSNLFDITGWLSTPDGDKPASNGVPCISMQLEPRTNYTVSTNIPDRGSLYDVFAMRSGETSSSALNGLSIVKPQTVLTNNDGMLQVAMRDYSLNRESGYWIKVEKGEMVTTFNGYATPTPDYPIEIHSLNDFDVVSSVGKENLVHDGKEIIKPLNALRAGLIEEGLGLDAGNYTIQFEYEITEGNTTPPVGFLLYNNSSQEGSGGLGQIVLDKTHGQKGKVVHQFSIAEGSARVHKGVAIYAGDSAGTSRERGMVFKNVKIEKDSESPYSPAPEDITEDSNPPLIDKANISLSEPLRSIGDVKDRLFRDSDGLWKIERNVSEHTFTGSETFGSNATYGAYYSSGDSLHNETIVGVKSNYLRSSSGWGLINGEKNAIGLASNTRAIRMSILVDGAQLTHITIKPWLTEKYNSGNPLIIQYLTEVPSIEILPQELQDKLSNIASYKDSNYLYTIVDKTNILPSNIQDDLKPTLHATFKSQTWYQNYKRGDDLRHFVEVKGLDRAIRFGMLVDYQSFATPTANWLYFCKIKTSTDDFREELVDEDGSIFDYTTQREIKVPKQALDLRGVAEGTTGYLAFDTRNELMWFIHYQRNYTYTTNQETGIIEKIPSSEYWIRWNPGKTGHNTQLVLDESVYIVGEIER